MSNPETIASFARSVGASAEEVMRASPIGFESPARLGGGGLGIAANQRHSRSTGIVGCFGAAVATAVLHEADSTQPGDALGLAATWRGRRHAGGAGGGAARGRSARHAA